MDRLNSFTSFTSLKETVLAKAPSLATIKTTLTAVVRFRGNTEAPPLRKTPEPESQPKLKPPPHKHPIVTPFEQLRSPSSGNGWFGTEPGIDDRALTLQRGLALISERGVAEPALSNIKKAAVEIFNNAQHNTEPPKDREPAADAAKQLPPAQEVFDELLQRKQNTVGHTNNGLSRMTSAFMDLIWLNTFKPDSTGAQMNSISPTFDLFPLYGPETSTIDIRLKDGYGRLAPDCFYDDRLFFMSDATSVLLILLNRNHNFIAQQLLNHPRSSWVTPNDVFDMDSGIIKPDWEKQDEEIFRMARLINCAQFRNIVSEDFLKLLSGLASVGPGLNLGKQITTYDHSREYQSTPETSCLYDWHALTSEEDLLRLKADIKRVFGQDNNVPQDLSVVPDVISKASMTSRTLRNHARLQRGTDNKFVDTELADILRNAISSSAMPSASGVPQYLRNVAIDKIQRARKASSHTLNEYRKALGLKVYKDFKDWNSDPTVCEAAKKLYTTIDNLELYVGLQAEQAVPDSGLQFGYTKTFALLADVVSKISNDPISRQVKDLPQWTSDMCDPEASLGNGAFGAWLPIIIQRSLPESFPYNNTYGLFPLATPEYVQTSFKKLESQLKTPKAIYTTSDEDVRKFSISRYSTTLPAGSSTVHTLITREAISHVLNDPKKFPTPYGESLKAITNGYGYLLGFDDPNMHDRDLMLTLYSLMPDRSVLNRYRSQFSQMVKQRLKAKSKQASNTNAVDIVNDVINPVCIKWVCKTLCAYEIPEAQESKMHEGLGDLYAFIFRNVHTDKAWKLRESAKRVSEILKSHIREKLPPPPKSHLRDLSESSYYMGSFQSLVPYLKRVSMEFFSKGLHLRLADPPTFLDRIVLANSGLPLDDETYRQLAKQYNIQKIQRNVELNNVDITRIAANIIGLAVVVSINYARSCAEAVDFYLDPARSQEREQLIKLAKKPRSAKNDELIMGYIREAQRIDQPLGIWRIVAEDTVIPSGDGDEVKFVAGDRIYADLREMHCKPATIDPQRRTPTVQGMGFHKCPGITFVEQTMPDIFRAIFSLDNIKAVDNKTGRLHRLETAKPNDPEAYVDSSGNISYYPRELVIQYNGAFNDEKDKSKEIYEDRPMTWREKRRIVINMAVLLVVFVFILYLLISLVRSIFGGPGLSLGFPSFGWLVPSSLWPFPRHTVSKPPDDIECTEIPRAGTWELQTFKRGFWDRKPKPIVFQWKDSKAYALNIVDVDKKDTEVKIWVDGISYGETSPFELNTEENCGTDYNQCLRARFSSARIYVPPGRHNITLVWSGKEPVDQYGRVKWGWREGRRIATRKDYCSKWEIIE